MFENLELTGILTVVLAIISTVAGSFWAKIKGKFGKAIILGKELIQASEALESALEDDKLTKKEIENLKKEFNDVKIAFKDLTKKQAKEKK